MLGLQGMGERRKPLNRSRKIVYCKTWFESPKHYVVLPFWGEGALSATVNPQRWDCLPCNKVVWVVSSVLLPSLGWVEV